MLSLVAVHRQISSDLGR